MFKCARVVIFALSLDCLGLGSQIVIAAGAEGNAEAAKIKNPVASSKASIVAGRAVYESHCVACHGTDGTGVDVGEYAAKPADLTRREFDHGSSDGEIYSVIKNGVGPDFFMDAWDGRISETDLWNLVNYVRTLQK